MLLQQYGETVTPKKTGESGRPRKPYKRWPKGSAYATVKKTYKRGHVVATARKLVYGTAADLDRALRRSPQSQRINTAFVERHNGTDRNYNSRKVRKTVTVRRTPPQPADYAAAVAVGSSGGRQMCGSRSSICAFGWSSIRMMTSVR